MLNFLSRGRLSKSARLPLRVSRRRFQNVHLRCQNLESRVTPAALFGFSGNNLLTFDSASPTSTSSIAVIGLASGETILDADVNPGTGQLVALGSSNRLYVINPTTGVATAIGAPGQFSLTGSKFGIDFDPVNDSLTVVSDADMNISLNASNGTVIATHPNLAFANGDANFGTNPNVTAIAYSNSLNGGTSAKLYGIDTNLDALVIEDPNTGKLTTVGGLGVNATSLASFDVLAGNSTGLAVLSVNGTSSALYSIDLATGHATLVGNVSGSSTLVGGVSFRHPSVRSSINGNTITINGSADNDTITLDVNASGQLRNNFLTQGIAGFNSNLDFDSTLPGDQTVSATSAVSVTINGFEGNDSVTLGSASRAGTNLGVNVTVDGGTDSDSVAIQASGDTTGRAVNVTSTQVTIPATNTTVNYVSVQSVQVNLGSGADTINVASVAPGVNTIINAEAGTDSFNIGSAGISAGKLDGTITLNGGNDADSLTFNATADTTGRTVNITNSQISIPATNTTVNFSDVGTIRVQLGSGSDSVTVGSATTAATTLAYDLFLDTDGGTDSVTINASGDTTGRLVNVTSTKVTVPATGTSINYANAENLRVVLGSGADSITIASTGANVNTVIDDSAGGASTIRVGTSVTGGTNSLANIQGKLTLIGNGSKNTLFVDNSDAPNTSGTTVFHISGNEVRVSRGADISFSKFDSVDVTGGAERDQFIVTPDANVAISIHGGNPVGGASGDSLIVNRSGTVGAKLTSTPSSAGFSGTWTFNGLQTVTFEGIESLHPKARIIVGAGQGGGPRVRVFDPETLEELFDFFAFSPSFHGGVNVAVGDVNGDGTADLVVAAASSGGPHVKVFDGETGALIREFFAYDASFTGGVNIAVGDVNGDGFADIVTAPASNGGPHIKVFSGADGSLLRQFFAYSPTFSGGVSVAVGDVNNDGFADIITAAGAGGGPHVKVFSGLDNSLLTEFFAFDANFTGGLTVAAGDFDHDGDVDIIVGQLRGGSRIRIFSGSTRALLRDFFAFSSGASAGVRIGVTDGNGDGIPDLIVGQGNFNQSSRFRFFRGDDFEQEGEDEFPFDDFQGGVFVGGHD